MARRGEGIKRGKTSTKVIQLAPRRKKRDLAEWAAARAALKEAWIAIRRAALRRPR